MNYTEPGLMVGPLADGAIASTRQVHPYSPTDENALEAGGKNKYTDTPDHPKLSDSTTPPVSREGSKLMATNTSAVPNDKKKTFGYYGILIDAGPLKLDANGNIVLR